MQLQLIKTDVVEDGLSYVDLCTVDGQLKTNLFEKKEEPNFFQYVLELDGDRMSDIRAEHEKSKEA